MTRIIRAIRAIRAIRGYPFLLQIILREDELIVPCLTEALSMKTLVLATSAAIRLSSR